MISYPPLSVRQELCKILLEPGRLEAAARVSLRLKDIHKHYMPEEYAAETERMRQEYLETLAKKCCPYTGREVV